MNIREKRKKIILDIMQDKHYVPMKIKEIAIVLNVSKEDRGELEDILNELIYEGKISLSKRGKYSLSKEKTATGIFIGNEKGFGFVEVEGEEEDFFIPEKYTRGAFYHDTVIITYMPAKEGRRREGKVIKILNHEITQVVGFYKKSKGFGFVIPDNKKLGTDIFVSEDKSMGAMSGHKVVVNILNYGTADRKPEGKITEIIGYVNDPGTDIMSIVKGYDLHVEFPDDVMAMLNEIPDSVKKEDCKNRTDFRDLQTVTIDGEDAKDLDDAITISKKENVYTLGVHIADVTNYVTEYSPLDREALKRGTSVYLVDRVIPMLPQKLSNGICSLNQGTDRLALSCVMEIDEKGNLLGHKILETVINVDRRMSYTEVNAVLKDDTEAKNRHKDFVEMFQLMKELSAIIRNRRHNRGAIDFDFPESKIILDEKGKAVDIKPYERNTATKIIEDFMLMANETIAENFYWMELPFLYRTHELPDREKMSALATFINNFGFSMHLGSEEIHPKELQKLLDKIEGSEAEAMISRLTLRSMKQARYTTQCSGHFGLAAKYYCHFTSPIRRYPDLQIHRIIKEYLHGTLDAKRIAHYNRILDSVAKDTSSLERKAEEAERDTNKLKMVEFMSDKIGQKFEGVISGVTKWGIYVELPNTVEGMVRISDIKGDYYVFNEAHFELVGEMTGKTFKLGQKVKVEVLDTDKLLKTIDFKLIVC